MSKGEVHLRKSVSAVAYWRHERQVDPDKSAVAITSSELKMFGMLSFYLSLNFVAVLLPVVGYLAFHGSAICRGLVVLTIIDYAIPLKYPALWLEWCVYCNDVAGKRSYFGAEVIFESEAFPPTKNYLLVYHPHSLFGVAYNAMTSAMYDRFGIITLFAGADVLAALPLLRRALSWWGYTPASAHSMKKNLVRPHPFNALMLMPGGVGEMFYGLEHEQVILARRKGFCKLALTTGCSLVPVYTFGANEVYTRAFGARSLAARLSSLLRISLVCWSGRFGIPFGFLPHKQKLVVAIGAPIDVARVPSGAPSQAQIEALHAKYVEQLRHLYSKHKHRMGEEWATRRDRLYLEDEALPGEAPGAVKKAQ